MKGVVLVGFMGTGKTAVGLVLAKKLQLPFVDTDDLIVQQAHKSVSRIFAEDGESAFRACETKILEQLAGHTQPQVIATGGGIVLAKHNWPLLRKLGLVVCLRATVQTIRERVGSGQGRPLLAGTPEEAGKRISDLLAARASAYAKADQQCETDQRMPEQIAEEIKGWHKTYMGEKGTETERC